MIDAIIFDWVFYLREHDNFMHTGGQIHGRINDFFTADSYFFGDILGGGEFFQHPVFTTDHPGYRSYIM